MTAITQNLPWFIRDPAVAVVGEVSSMRLPIQKYPELKSDRNCVEMLSLARRESERQ